MLGSIDHERRQDPQIPGLAWHVYVDYDEFSGTPEDNGDCYTATQIKAWENDSWQFVLLTVAPEVDGIELDHCRRTLGGVEYGEYTLTSEDDTVVGRCWINPLEPKIRHYKMVDGMISSTVYVEYDHNDYAVTDLMDEVRGNLSSVLAGRVASEVTVMQALALHGLVPETAGC